MECPEQCPKAGRWGVASLVAGVDRTCVVKGPGTGWCGRKGYSVVDDLAKEAIRKNIDQNKICNPELSRHLVLW